MNRVFSDSPAVRASVPLLIGLVAPSGGGKTYSALRLATGIQSVTGKDIFVIDTEANRALHYADQFKFRHVPFGAPFDPLSYLAAVEYCASKGAGVIVIDSASHMHEGIGGTLEAYESECERLSKAWNTTREKVQMAAWKKPKGDLRKFLNSVLQMPVTTIWCFRAKEKLKIIPGKQPVNLGFMPIAGDEMIYEMTVNCLLYPNSGGKPSWHSDEMGEKAIIKLPQQFKDIFSADKPLDEATGAAMAKWAGGDAASPPPPPPPPTRTKETATVTPEDKAAYIKLLQNAANLSSLQAHFRSAWNWAKKDGDKASQDEIKAKYDECKARFS